MSIRNRITRLEAHALNGPGVLALRFTTEGGLHVSATMPGVGTLHRGDDETNAAFEQRVFSAVREAASKGAVGYEHLSDETLRACMAATAI